MKNVIIKTPSERILAGTLLWHLERDNETQLNYLLRRMWDRFGFEHDFQLDGR